MLNLVATPIGNLDDISYRQAKTLSESDVILSEDTRSARTLLDRIEKLFGLKLLAHCKIWSYYKEREFDKLHEILTLLEEGKNISLITESGMPLISDPGYLLVHHASERNLPFTVIPGPSSVTTALVHSGFNPKNFLFLGFLPKKSSQLEILIKKTIEMKKILPDLVFVAFESPNRINKTLELFSNKLPESDFVVARELTKMFEEIARGKPSELKDREYKGEIVVLFK